jgi:O-antigen/teichoic acid export membrane protein
MAIITSVLIAILLYLLEYMIEGHVSYFPAIVAFFLIVPLRQMVILTRDIDRISKKMKNIERCLNINTKPPKSQVYS